MTRAPSFKDNKYGQTLLSWASWKEEAVVKVLVKLFVLADN